MTYPPVYNCRRPNSVAGQRVNIELHIKSAAFYDYLIPNSQSKSVEAEIENLWTKTNFSAF